MPNALQAMSLGVIILFLVVSVPVVVDSTTGDNSQTLQLEEEDTVSLSNRLELTNERIRPPTPENATFTVRDTETLESQTQLIQNGSQATYELSGGNVTVAVTSITDSQTETVTATVTYGTTYGWSDGAQTLANNLPLILVVVGFIVVLGILKSVI